jgi:hypothetical protein
MFHGKLSNVLIVENDCGEVYFIEDKNKKSKINTKTSSNASSKKNIQIKSQESSDDEEEDVPLVIKWVYKHLCFAFIFITRILTFQKRNQARTGRR